MTEGGTGTFVPTVAVWFVVPAPGVIEAGSPGTAVAVNVTGGSLGTLAVTEFSPRVVPRIHPVVVATPSASVAASVGTTVPPPATTLKLTITLDRGAPLLSVTTTAGGTATAVAMAVVCATVPLAA
jgi:hypothetical protein